MSTPDPSELVERIVGLELFRGTNPELLEGIVRRSELHSLPTGGVVIAQGEENAFMWLVLEGELEVHLGAVDDEPVARIVAGETVGEMSVLDPGPASAWVVAATPARLLAMDERVAWALTHASHEFCLSLLRKLTCRIRQSNATVERSTERRRAAERDANHDQLTGVLNRRGLEALLCELFDDKARGLSLAVLDVDHFKRFNDTHGHQAGDEVLVAVAETVRSQLRPNDLVARLGGEEFVVVLPDTYLDGAHAAAERVRRAVSQRSVVTEAGVVLPPVSVSIGVATRCAGLDPEGLIARADEALYEAKDAGRDRVVIAAPLPRLVAA